MYSGTNRPMRVLHGQGISSGMSVGSESSSNERARRYRNMAELAKNEAAGATTPTTKECYLCLAQLWRKLGD